MKRKDERLAERLRGRGWLVMSPQTFDAIDPFMDTIVVPIPGRGADRSDCPAHGRHPHNGGRCLDCAVCAGEDPCFAGCSDPAMHAEGGHDV
jgi:hypothetical protein